MLTVCIEGGLVGAGLLPVGDAVGSGAGLTVQAAVTRTVATTATRSFKDHVYITNPLRDETCPALLPPAPVNPNVRPTRNHVVKAAPDPDVRSRPGEL